MSCKIVAASHVPTAKRLTFRRLGIDSAKPSVPIYTEPADSAGDLAELHKLRGRVVELEQALEYDVRQARESAYREGLSAGQEAASAELKPAMARLLQSCQELAGLRARIRKETESDLVALTIAIARRVLRRELSVDPEAIHGVVIAALSKMQAKELSVIHTNPEHVEAIRTYLAKAGIGPGVEIAADATLPVGGIVLETKRGNLDASVETQLKEIERGFTDRLGN
jgi:flagellar assembly protein FliH